jgi:hypothetical protein
MFNVSNIDSKFRKICYVKYFINKSSKYRNLGILSVCVRACAYVGVRGRGHGHGRGRGHGHACVYTSVIAYL